MSEESIIRNYRIFEVSHLEPTNTLGSRVKIKDVHSQEIKNSVLLNYDYGTGCIYKQAIKYLQEERKINISGQSGSYKNKYLLLSDSSWGADYRDLVEKKEK